MKYMQLKDLIADIQKGVLDPKTILLDVDWKRNQVEIFDKDETLWCGYTLHAFLEILHRCLGVLTIHDMQMVVFEERCDTTAERPCHILQGSLRRSYQKRCGNPKA